MAGLLVIVKTGLVERTLFVMTGGAGLMATGGVMTKLGGNSGGITESSRPLRSQIVRFTMRCFLYTISWERMPVSFQYSMMVPLPFSKLLVCSPLKSKLAADCRKPDEYFS